MNKRLSITVLSIISLIIFCAPVWATKISVTYNPRTGIATLGIGEDKIEAVIKDIEKLLSTAKQVSVDKKGCITAVIDIDPKQLQQTPIDKENDPRGNNDSKDIIIIRPLNNSTVSKPNLRIEGIVVDKRINRMDVRVEKDGKDRRYRSRVRNGKFSANVTLTEGENAIALSTRNKSGKIYQRSINVNYLPAR
ncbi:hypothetical protein ACFL9T_01515 [Thermodesulfobacteriota bacterium]